MIKICQMKRHFLPILSDLLLALVIAGTVDLDQMYFYLCISVNGCRDIASLFYSLMLYHLHIKFLCKKILNCVIVTVAFHGVIYAFYMTNS